MTEDLSKLPDEVLMVRLAQVSRQLREIQERLVRITRAWHSAVEERIRICAEIRRRREH